MDDDVDDGEAPRYIAVTFNGRDGIEFVPAELEPAAPAEAAADGANAYAVDIQTGSLSPVTKVPPQLERRASNLAALLPIGSDLKARVRILIVDDEHTLRESCASVLRQEGYDVTVSGRGQEAHFKVFHLHSAIGN